MLQDQLETELGYQGAVQEDFSCFLLRVFQTIAPGDEYIDNWHVDAMADALEACRRRELKRLVINVPPRALKSISANVAFSAWLLGHNPSEKIISASYAKDLSVKNSVDARDVMQSEWYRDAFPDTVIKKDQNTKGKIETTAKGHRIAVSVGGQVTGEGGSFLIIDDPVNPQQAENKKMRDRANKWYDRTFSNRLNNKKNDVIILIMQRLHCKDLTAHVLAEGGWEHLKLPAEFKKPTLISVGGYEYQTKQNELLQPARENREVLDREKAKGSYYYAGQYLQEPIPDGGGIVKMEWIKRYKVRQEKYIRIIQSWDTANKAKELNDPSCCTTWGEKENGYDLLHVLNERMEYPDLKRTARNHAEAWKVDALLIEDKASGQQLIQEFQRDTKLPVIAIEPEGDKITRMAVESAQFEAGKVFLPESGSWMTDYEIELTTFPMADHDDQVDSTSQFLRWVKNNVYMPYRIRQL